MTILCITLFIYFPLCLSLSHLHLILPFCSHLSFYSSPNLWFHRPTNCNMCTTLLSFPLSLAPSLLQVFQTIGPSLSHNRSTSKIKPLLLTISPSSSLSYKVSHSLIIKLTEHRHWSSWFGSPKVGFVGVDFASFGLSRC